MRGGARWACVGCGVWLALGIPVGCVQIPSKTPTAEIRRQELAVSVHFLAGPRRDGRTPNSLGSWQTRAFIKDRFRACGLKPWGTSSGFNEPFWVGTNVIGVLPGSDPVRRDEIVLVSAHYDHVGADHPGAADNAAGVAAMLEIAECLSLGPSRPRRTVVFAAFDAEEQGLLGAFVFTCRKDFDPAKLAAVVNIDVLGRNFFDVTQEGLIVVGTECYPKTRARAVSSGRAQELRVYPVGTDLAGMTGDHAAFELWPVPCLFFTDGYYRDYHQPTDTADKIDYAKLEREARVVADTVGWLANAETPETAVAVRAGDREELLGIQSFLTQVCARDREAGLKAEDKESLHAVAREAEVCLSRPAYTLDDRQRLLWQLAGTVVPMTVFKISDIEVPASVRVKDLAERKRKAIRFMAMSVADFSARHRAFLIRTTREAIRYSLDHKLECVFGGPKFELTACDVVDSEICVTGGEQGPGRLSVLMPKVEIRRGGSMGFDLTGSFDFVGTREEMVDFCLVRWRKEAGNPFVSEAWRKILVRVTGKDRGEAFDGWLRWRLERGRMRASSDWILSLVKNRNPRIVGETLMHAWDRCPADREKGLALALVDLLTDDRPYANDGEGVLWDPTYPFYDYPEAGMIRSLSAVMSMTPALFCCPVRDLAHRNLKGLTGQDFGEDVPAWRAWIEKNMG